jgi:hypothetical protein
MRGVDAGVQHRHDHAVAVERRRVGLHRPHLVLRHRALPTQDPVGCRKDLNLSLTLWFSSLCSLCLCVLCVKTRRARWRAFIHSREIAGRRLTQRTQRTQRHREHRGERKPFRGPNRQRATLHGSSRASGRGSQCDSWPRALRDANPFTARRSAAPDGLRLAVTAEPRARFANANVSSHSSWPFGCF